MTSLGVFAIACFSSLEPDPVRFPAKKSFSLVKKICCLDLLRITFCSNLAHYRYTYLAFSKKLSDR